MKHCVVVLCMVIGSECLTSAGSSLLCPVMQACLKSYNELNLSTGEVTYDCIGSGNGKKSLLSNETVMAGTDSLFDDESYHQRPDLQMIPVVAAPIAITFNVGEHKSIALDRETIGKIFNGNITRWSDPHISYTNPSKHLPDMPINVVVRDDSSGTTEIMTKALSSFGVWDGPITNTWPKGTPVERRSKSSGVLEYVANTPFSIGYSGISGVLKEGLPFVTVTNRAGALTIPGWSDGEQATAGLILDPVRLTGDLIDGIGYPISGLSYLAFFTTPNSQTCEVAAYILWMLTSTVSRSIIRANNLVPLDNTVINDLLTTLSIDGCSDQLSVPIPMYTGQQGEFKGIANEIGYRYYQENLLQYVQVSEEEDTNVMIRSENDPLPPSKEDLYLKVKFASGMLTLACNFGIDVPSMELDLSVITDVFLGNIKFWNNTQLSERSSYVPKQNIPILIVAHKSTVYYNRMVEQLGIAGKTSREPDVVLGSHTDVIQHVKHTVGTIAVVDFAMASQWGIPQIYPVVNDVPSIPSSNTLARFAESDGQPSTYPFAYQIDFYVKKQVTGSECQTAHALLSKWMVSSDNTAESLKKHMMHPISENGTIDKLQTLRCNDEFIFQQPEKSSSSDLLYILIGVIGGFLLVLGAGLLVAFSWSWRRERLRYESAFGAQVLAAEMAEAIAVLDFNSLEKVLTLENPDRIQTAIKDITIMMKEFVKYIPQSVIKAVRNESDDDTTDQTLDTYSQFTSRPNILPPSEQQARQLSKTSSEVVSRNGVGLTKKLDHAVRCVSALVVRKLHTTGSQGFPEKEQSEFLGVCLHEIELMHGTVHRITEDAVVGTWGSMTEQRRHPDTKNICEAATMITKRCPQANCGVNSGLAHCGSLGNDKIRTFHIMGGIIEEADNLCRVAQASKARCLLPYNRCLDLWGHTFKFARFFGVASVFGGRPTEAAVLLGEALARINSKEWMYELEDREKGPEPGPEEAMHVLLNSNSFEDALETLNKYCLSCDVVSPYTKWLESTLTAFKTLYPDGTLPGMPVFEVTCVGTLFTTCGQLIGRPDEGLLKPASYLTPSNSNFATPRGNRLSPPPLLSPPQLNRSPPPSAQRLHRPDILR